MGIVGRASMMGVLWAQGGFALKSNWLQMMVVMKTEMLILNEVIALCYLNIYLLQYVSVNTTNI